MSRTPYATPVRRIPRLNLREYRGQWVVLDPKTCRVLTHGASLRVAEREARKRGVRKPLLFPVPKSDAYFIGLS